MSVYSKGCGAAVVHCTVVYVHTYVCKYIYVRYKATGLSVMDGIEPEIPGEVIHLDQDRAFSAFRDPENSESDYSDVEEDEDSSAI